MAGLIFAELAPKTTAGIDTAFVTVTDAVTTRQICVTNLTVCNIFGSQILVNIRKTVNGIAAYLVKEYPLDYGDVPLTWDGTIYLRTAGDIVEVSCNQTNGCDVSAEQGEYIG